MNSFLAKQRNGKKKSYFYTFNEFIDENKNIGGVDFSSLNSTHNFRTFLKARRASLGTTYN